MKNIIMILALLFVATTAFGLPGDPPLRGGSCDLNQQFNVHSPDFPWPVSAVHHAIREQTIKMLRAKMAPYIEISPETGQEIIKGMYLPQADAAKREVEEWERRARDKVEKYMENDQCPNGLGLVIRNKYLDLIF